MTTVKVQTADFALAVAGAVLAAFAGWRPEQMPAWVCLVPIGLLVIQNVVLLPHQILVAHEGWKATRDGQNPRWK